MNPILLIILIINLSACGAILFRNDSEKVLPATRVLTTQQKQELMLQSMQLLGTPYRWGGGDKTGFDCSGLVQYVYQRAIDFKLPRTAKEMASSSQSVAKKDLQVGDLIFFNTSGNDVSHVGIYIGDNRFIHAPRSGTYVQIESLHKPYYAQRWVKSGRFLK